MSDPRDCRIPIVIGQTDHALPGDCILNWPATAAGHVLGCPCCQARTALGRLLGSLFLAQARGEVTPFARVLLIGVEDAQTVAAAIEADVLTRARYRFAGRAG